MGIGWSVPSFPFSSLWMIRDERYFYDLIIRLNQHFYFHLKNRGLGCDSDERNQVLPGLGLSKAANSGTMLHVSLMLEYLCPSDITVFIM